MTINFTALAGQTAAQGAITADDVLALRRTGWGDGVIRMAEAEALLALDAQLDERPREWTDFFVEAITEYLIAGGSPRGYVTQDQGDWLIAGLGAGNVPVSPAALELLAKLLDRATFAPENVRTFALAELERSVLTGDSPGCVTEAEARLLRRVLFAAASDRPAAISRREAEVLFRIKDATLGAANAPDWSRLFVQGVGNYLSGWSVAGAVDADRAIALKQFMDDSTPHLGRFFARMAGGVGSGLSEIRKPKKRMALDTVVEDAATDRAITTDEEAWLSRQMAANGQVDPLDQALLDFLNEDR